MKMTAWTQHENYDKIIAFVDFGGFTSSALKVPSCVGWVPLCGGSQVVLRLSMTKQNMHAWYYLRDILYDV